MKEGWICPRCGKVNAPFMPQCDCEDGKHHSNYRKLCTHDWILDSAEDTTGLYLYHCRICGATTTTMGCPMGAKIIK